MTDISISVEPIENLPDQPIDISELKSTDYYPEKEKKVFFGHYWLKGELSLYKTISVAWITALQSAENL